MLSRNMSQLHRERAIYRAIKCIHSGQYMGLELPGPAIVSEQLQKKIPNKNV